MDLQESTQRKSFNPEAAAFSPTPAATMTDNAFIGQEQHQRSTLAAGNVNMPGGKYILTYICSNH